MDLSELLCALSTRAMRALDDLERDPFDAESHAERFQKAWRLTLAVRDIARTRILDGDSELDADTARLIVKYREME